MKTYTENLAAGVPLKLSLGGRVFYMQKASQGPVVTVEFLRGGSVAATVDNVGKGFKAMPDGGFDTLRFKSAVAGEIVFVVTDGDLTFAFDQDKTVIGNDDSEALPIRQAVGSPPIEVTFSQQIVPLGSVVTNDAANLVDTAPVALGAVAVQIVAADAQRRSLRLRNTGAAPFALTAAAGTAYANAAVIIQPGETWIENDGPACAWYGICDAGAATNVAFQQVKK